MEIIYEHHTDTAANPVPIWGPKQDAHARALILDLFLSFHGDNEYIIACTIAAEPDNHAAGIWLETSKGQRHDEIMTRLLVAVLKPHTYRPEYPDRTNIMFTAASLGDCSNLNMTSHDKIARIRRFVDLQTHSDFAVRLMLLALKKAADDRAFKRANF